MVVQRSCNKTRCLIWSSECKFITQHKLNVICDKTNWEYNFNSGYFKEQIDI